MYDSLWLEFCLLPHTFWSHKLKNLHASSRVLQSKNLKQVPTHGDVLDVWNLADFLVLK